VNGRLVVMSRWPAPLRCKRRLAVRLGAERAAAVQARLTAHCLRTGRRAVRLRQDRAVGERWQVVLAVGGAGRRCADRWGHGVGADRVVLQGGGGLGVRMQRQTVQARREGAAAVVLIGSDLPTLGPGDLLAAFEGLERADVVLGPAHDGGYWLIGLRQPCAALFAGAAGPIGWGGDRVLEQTLAAARRAGRQVLLLAERSDLDRPADLETWR
jgi:rSAM/selenodomain-associated transferase 1